MQSRAEDLNSLMSKVETTEVGKQFQVLTVLGKNWARYPTGVVSTVS